MGVTFLMVLPQTFLAFFLVERKKEFFSFIKEHLIPVIGYGILVLASIIYGIVGLAYWNGQTPDLTWRRHRSTQCRYMEGWVYDL